MHIRNNYKDSNSENKKNKIKMLIVSFDAMGARDMEYIKELQNFQKFMEEAAICINVSSVYPTLTYPAHTSIVTGRYPRHHGVINNTVLQPERSSPDWMWQRKYIKGTTLYDEAIKAGMKTAALLWPVTAKSKIHYNLPEVLANRPWENQVMVSALNGTALYELELLRKFGHLRDGIRQPELDNFVHASALHTIEKYNPDLTMIHLTDLDTNRHVYGVEHEKAYEAMRRHDKRLGELIDVLKRTGDYEKTVIVLLGDHCQIDCSCIVYFNYLFLQKGYLTVKNGKIKTYKVIAKNCDGSCYIYIKDKSIYKEVKELLARCAKKEKYGIEKIFTGEKAGELGADNTCDFMIEGKSGYYYLDEFEEETTCVENAKAHKMRATHGYLPEKPNYQTFFMMKGPGVRKSVEISEMSLIDEGPTLAKLLGVSLLETDGRCIDEFLT